jgi:hypothetical protein
MTPESRNSSLPGNGSVKHIRKEAIARNIRKAVFSVIRAARVAMQQCGKHISAAVNQHATIEEAVFSMGPPGGYIYNEDLKQLEL